MAGAAEPRHKGGVDEEIDSGYPEVAKSVKAHKYDISYGPSSDKT